jgi:hypothetical protein
MSLRAIDGLSMAQSLTIREQFAISIFSAMVKSGNYNTHQAVYLAQDLINSLNSISPPDSNEGHD